MPAIYNLGLFTHLSRGGEYSEYVDCLRLGYIYAVGQASRLSLTFNDRLEAVLRRCFPSKWTVTQ